ncbi:hypothetical protein CCMA1212_002333 [Trichoderma ghanense]|uniref:Uncharacterized protein n=1 Tax=Trichoderma ghanense TaxID=65468 RepID=A0ABY2HDI6_9HYPO
MNIWRDQGPKASFAGEAEPKKATQTTDRGPGRRCPAKATDTQKMRDAEGPMTDTGALAWGLAARGGKEASISARGGTRAASESTLTPSFSAGSSSLLRS